MKLLLFLLHINNLSKRLLLQGPQSRPLRSHGFVFFVSFLARSYTVDTCGDRCTDALKADPVLSQSESQTIRRITASFRRTCPGKCSASPVDSLGVKNTCRVPGCDLQFCGKGNSRLKCCCNFVSTGYVSNRFHSVKDRNGNVNIIQSKKAKVGNVRQVR